MYTYAATMYVKVNFFEIKVLKRPKAHNIIMCIYMYFNIASTFAYSFKALATLKLYG